MTQSSRRSNSLLLTLFAFFVAPATLWSAVPLVQKNPPVRPSDADSPVLIWDIELARASALPRNFRTTDDRLKAIDARTPSTTGLIDLHAAGSGELWGWPHRFI